MRKCVLEHILLCMCKGKGCMSNPGGGNSEVKLHTWRKMSWWSRQHGSSMTWFTVRVINGPIFDLCSPWIRMHASLHNAKDECRLKEISNGHMRRERKQCDGQCLRWIVMVPASCCSHPRVSPDLSVSWTKWLTSTKLNATEAGSELGHYVTETMASVLGTLSLPCSLLGSQLPFRELLYPSLTGQRTECGLWPKASKELKPPSTSLQGTQEQDWSGSFPVEVSDETAVLGNTLPEPESPR